MFAQYRLFYLLAFSLCLVACVATRRTNLVATPVPTPQVTVIPVPTVVPSPTVAISFFPPTPELQPAPLSYLDDVQPIPPGKYLFVESWEHISGSSSCPEMVHIDEPTYGYSCGNQRCAWEWKANKPTGLINDLWGDFIEENIDPTAVTGFWGVGTSITGVGGGVGSFLNSITQFPQQEKAITLLGLTDTGIVVIERAGSRYLIEPKQSWMEQEYADEAWFRQFLDEDASDMPGCVVTITRRFTNFGLLDASEIDVGIPLVTP